MPVVSCAQCGKEFEVNQARLDARRGRYCSRACVNISRRNPAKCCECCGVEIKNARRTSKFCSRQCGAGFSSINRTASCAVCKEKFVKLHMSDTTCSASCEFVKLSSTGKFQEWADPYENGLGIVDVDRGAYVRQPDYVLGY